MTERIHQGQKGLFESLTALSATLVAILHTRLQLLSTDLEEDRSRWMSQMIAWLVSVFCLMLGAVMIVVIVIVAFWDSHRMLTLWSVAAFFISAGLFAWAIARYKAKTKPKLFIASLLELLKDHQQLDIH